MALSISGSSPSFSSYQGGTITSGTAVATTSGTAITYTSIPSWVKRITVNYVGVNSGSTTNPLTQLGTSGGIVTTGYSAWGQALATSSTAGAVFSSGLPCLYVVTNGTFNGVMTWTLLSGNTWVGQGSAIYASGSAMSVSTSSITLASALTQISFTTTNGATFSAGSINILYE